MSSGQTTVQRQVELQGGTLTLSLAAEQQHKLDELCGFASRQNPKRAFLFVSKVLGKHIPARPSAMLRTHEELAAKIAPHLGEDGVLFLGFAETATGLGAGVFEACGHRRNGQDLFVQTTRYQFDAPVALHFQEEHSHSTGHILYEPQTHSHLVRNASTVVLIDDELSTGKTSANFIRELQELNPHLNRVVLVSLLNWMSPARRQAIAAELPSLRLEFVSLVEGSFEFEMRPGYVCPAMPNVDSIPENKDGVIPGSYGRFGEAAEFQLEAGELAASLKLNKEKPVHVLGDGEFLHPPFKFALALENLGYDVYFQSTTRSPILVGDAIDSRTCFSDHYRDGIENFAYNLPADDAQLVLCHESAADLSLLTQRPMKTVTYAELACAQSF